MGRNEFDRWLTLAQAQLEAARKVDAPGLASATQARAELQRELARTPLAALQGADREHAARIAREVRAIDVRIHACASAVIGIIERVVPDVGPRTYGPRGRLNGV
jgi:hypothetical protein